MPLSSQDVRVQTPADDVARVTFSSLCSFATSEDGTSLNEREFKTRRRMTWRAVLSAPHRGGLHALVVDEPAGGELLGAVVDGAGVHLHPGAYTRPLFGST